MPATATSTHTSVSRRCSVKKVEVGSVFTRHSFGVVTRVDPVAKKVFLKNTAGVEWEISNDILEHEFTFADQYETTETVSRTRAIEIMMEHPGTAMTVNYHKKLEPKVVAAALKAGQGKLSDKDWQKLVDGHLVGEERTMVGQHHAKFDEHQRLHFDEHDVGSRLVDPRTIQWLIVNRARYDVKKS